MQTLHVEPQEQGQKNAWCAASLMPRHIYMTRNSRGKELACTISEKCPVPTLEKSKKKEKKRSLSIYGSCWTRGLSGSSMVTRASKFKSEETVFDPVAGPGAGGKSVFCPSQASLGQTCLCLTPDPPPPLTSLRVYGTYPYLCAR